MGKFRHCTRIFAASASKLATSEVIPLPIRGDWKSPWLMQEPGLRGMAAAVPQLISVDCRIEEAAYVHDAIVAQLAATHADLLVLGMHGRSG
jgi:nucleotide-binding universal stress UspA family protein